MDKASSEIAKLTERISKDPKSKLFVPLAEEYKKTGDIDMAIQVLMEGLKNNPSYVTARSFLGRLLMEKGNLAGAQKELEEVIKAIPDNLLAQRKLGDIYVLQGKSKDALNRYQSAIALNPGDKEILSLISDIEAGKDIAARIPRPKVQTLAAPVEKPQPTVSPAPPKATPAAGMKPAVAQAEKPTLAPQAAQVQPPTATPTVIVGTQVTPPTASPAMAAAPPVAPAQELPDEAEVVEDIIDIEPLEQPAPAPEPKEAEFHIPAEFQMDLPQMPRESPASVAFDLSEQAVDGSQPEEEPTAVVWEGEETALPPGRPAEPEEGSDDLNTNTLAELYISQGFYDKAIEIYKGMLSERPGNKALQHKLEQLRAMAGTAEKGSEGFTAINAGPGEYSPLSASADVFSDSEKAPAATTPSAPQAITESPAMEEKPLVEMSTAKTAPAPTPDTSIPAGPQAASLRRKETIDRLESWLKNIMKENH
jgi:tetratricopeptide (TPR) repeat protein